KKKKKKKKKGVSGTEGEEAVQQQKNLNNDYREVYILECVGLFGRDIMGYYGGACLPTTCECHTFASWKFGPQQSIPITISELNFDDDHTGWGWKPDTSKLDYMSILTPVHPIMNCAHNVIRPTFDLLHRELCAGDAIVGKLAPHVSNGRVISIDQWKMLLSRKEFFMDSRACYIDVACSASCPQYRRIWLLFFFFHLLLLFFFFF
ncbi:hypothetical protein RFI_33308, partial [Reticulomyxa filosa]